MRVLFARVASGLLLTLFALLLPIGPILLALATGKLSFVRRYPTTVRKSITHMRQLIATEAFVRFFSGRGHQPEADVAAIGGHCNRCGNCCLDRKCMFLEVDGEDRVACGIFGTTLRSLGNCGDYPGSQYEIDLYECPTYYVIPVSQLKARIARDAAARPVDTETVFNSSR